MNSPELIDEACIRRANRIAYALRVPDHLREDARQSALLGMVKALATFEPGSGACFRTFAERRAAGEVLDFLRDQDPLSRRDRHSVKQGLAQDVSTQSLDALLVNGFNLRSRARLQDARVLGLEIRRLVAGLPRLERFVLEAMYCDDVAPKDIATALGVPAREIYAVRARALKALRNLMEHPAPCQIPVAA